jgi:enterochelin esterase-like enzyme
MEPINTGVRLNGWARQMRHGALLFSVLWAVKGIGAAPVVAENMHTYSSPSLQIVEHQVLASAFKQNVQVQVFLPPNYSKTSNVQYPSLYFNDGQDAEAVGLAETLRQLVAEQKISPVIVIAVAMLPDRMGTYGFSDREAQLSLPAETRYGAVGLRAYEYSNWLAESLVPYIDARYRTKAKPEARTILGWSLGAANAFNLGWNYPDVFGRVGGFSPSFWLRAKSDDPSTAIVQTLIAQKPMPPHFTLWLAVGGAEETEDRDGDGIIDVIDDAQGVIEALNSKSEQSNIVKIHTHFNLVPFQDGQHNPQTWRRVLPEFLIWAYPLDSGKGK